MKITEKYFPYGLFILFLLGSTTPAIGGSAYPPSSVFETINWDFSTLKTAAPGSDLWAVTWGADDNLYTAWGDGGGFGGTNSRGRVYMGVARIEGSPGTWQGFNVFGGYNGEVPATFIGKSTNIISVDGSLYMFVTEQGVWQRAKIGRSDDYGKTWTFNNGSFANSGWDFAEAGGAFAGPAFIEFGKDNSGALDAYIYLYSRRTRNANETELLLCRVLRTKIQSRADYEFFNGTDGLGKPLWSKDLAQAKTIFEDKTNGLSWGYGALYLPAYKRYILTMRATDSNNGRYGNWGIYDAPNPWGPWTTVVHYDNWDAGTPIDGAGEQILFNFPAKWLGADNLTMWMIMSVSDSFNVIKGSLKLRGSGGGGGNVPLTPTGTKVVK